MSVRRPWLERLALAWSILLLALHGFLVVRACGRALDYDEAQHLHIAWLLSRGLLPFRDFQESHSPLLSQLLRVLQPSSTTHELPLLDVRTFAERARLLAALAGTAGVVGAACVAAQVTRTLTSAATAATFIVASHWLWMRGVVDARPEPFASMGMWLGAALMLRVPPATMRGALRLGLAMALPVGGFLVSPKFPVVLMVLGAWFAWSAVTIGRAERRLVLVACAPPLFTLAAGVAALARVASPSDLLLYVVRVNTATARWFRDVPVLDDPVSTPLFYCPPLCWGAAPMVAFAGLVYVVLRRAAHSERRGALFVALVVAAAFVEIRWIYTFPRLWPQYFATWGFALAIAFGCVPQLVVGAQGGDPGGVPARRAIAEIASVLAAGALLATHLDQIPVPGNEDNVRWAAVSFVQRHLRPSEPVWIRADFHPIGAPDASYYWTSFADVVPATMQYAARTGDARLQPAVGDAALPLCRVLAGGEAPLRFVSYAWEDLRYLPDTKGCLAALQAQERICPTPYPPLVYLRAPGGTCDLGP
jgi:hypothetical protein